MSELGDLRERIITRVSETAIEWDTEFDPEWDYSITEAPKIADALLPLLAESNPFPVLHARYDAVKAANLGKQLLPDEITERIRIELGNAFAAGALWQYGRGPTSLNTSKEDS